MTFCMSMSMDDDKVWKLFYGDDFFVEGGKDRDE